MAETILEIGELGTEPGEERADGDRIDGGDDDGHPAEDRAGDGHTVATRLSLPHPLDGHDAEHEGHDADQPSDDEEERDDADDAEHQRRHGEAIALLRPVARGRWAVTAGPAPAAGRRRGVAARGRAVP